MKEEVLVVLSQGTTAIPVHLCEGKCFGVVVTRDHCYSGTLM